MKDQFEDKREGAKKIMHAIGELPDDMILRANPENWKDGVYVGKDDLKESEDKAVKEGSLKIISKWIMKKRKMVAFAATVFLCVIAAGVWKMNGVDENIRDKINNDWSEDIVQSTSEPENTYTPLHDTNKKHKKKHKNKVKVEKKKIKKEHDNKTAGNNKKPKQQKSEPDKTTSPGIEQYSDTNDEDVSRRRTGAGEDEKNISDDNDTKYQTTEPSLADTADSSDADASVDDVTAYKIDEQGNKIVVNISADAEKLAVMLDEKKYLTDADTGGCVAVIRYKEKDYYYDPDAKMLIISGKGAKLSDSENAELKKILKLD